MSQHGLSDYDPTARTGTDLQAIFDAFQSGHMGTSRPSYATKGTVWFKEIGDPFTSIQEYLYDGSGDRLLREYFADGRIRTYFSNDGDQWIDANAAANILSLGAGNTEHFQLNSSGHLLPATDNVSDFGNGSRRVRDFYVGGGLYLGGTGVANKLDDYEKGTFTPVLEGSSSNPSVTYVEQGGDYVLVGDVVHCWGHIKTSARTGGSGVLYIGGLPFTSYGSSDVNWFTGVIGYKTNFSDNAPGGLMIPENSAQIALWKNSSTTNPRGNMNSSFNVTDWQNTSELYFQISYRI